MLPYYLVGVIVFLLILLMFQALRLTEFVLVHGVSYLTLAKLILFLSTSFLPVILPMSLLFTVLFIYNRLSGDSEILAFYTLGLNVWTLSLPAAVLATCVGVVSGFTSFYWGPWGNRQFEVLIEKLGQMKAETAIKGGTFSEGFFDFVIYANRVDAKKGQMFDVFLYDERDQNNPFTIIAKEGIIIHESTETEHRGFLLLSDGNIHRARDSNYTKIDFKTYRINLSNPIHMRFREKSMSSLTIAEIEENLRENPKDAAMAKGLVLEYHKRFAISFACLLFAIVGVGIGTTIYHRQAGGGIVMCIGLIVLYWVLYIAGENLARSQNVPPIFSIWLANIVFGGFGIWKMLRLARI